MSAFELPSYDQVRGGTGGRLPRPLASIAGHFSREISVGSGSSRPSSPVPSDAEEPVASLKKARKPLSRKHLEQAVRLYGEVLSEELTTDYAFDLHFSALDYALKALPDQSFDDSPARKANVRRRLNKLLEQVGTADAANPTPAEGRWWQPNLPFGGSGVAPVSTTPGADGSFALLGQCPSCATRVPIEVPAWMADGRKDRGTPATWEELAVAAVVGLAVAIKQSPIPLILTAAFSAIVQGLLYLDSRFEIHRRFLLLLGGIIEALVVLDRELGVLRRCGDLLHKGWEIGISAMLAFAKAEGYQPARSSPSVTAQPVSLPTSAAAPEPMESPFVVTAPTPPKRPSASHGARASWHGRTSGYTHLSMASGTSSAAATHASTGASAAARRSLRSPASYDQLRLAATSDLTRPDSDRAVPAGRGREDGWTGRLNTLMPGRR